MRKLSSILKDKKDIFIKKIFNKMKKYRTLV